MTLRRIIAGIEWRVAHGGRFVSMSDPVVYVSAALAWTDYGNAVPPCVNQPGDSCFPMACHQMGFETGNLTNLHIIMEFQAGLGWERPQG